VVSQVWSGMNYLGDHDRARRKALGDRIVPGAVARASMTRRPRILSPDPNRDPRRRRALGRLLQPRRDRAGFDDRHRHPLPGAVAPVELPGRAVSDRQGPGRDVAHRVRGEPDRPDFGAL